MCYFLQTVDYIHSFLLLSLSLYISLNFILKSNSVKLDYILYHRLKTQLLITSIFNCAVEPHLHSGFGQVDL